MYAVYKASMVLYLTWVKQLLTTAQVLMCVKVLGLNERR